MPTRCATKTLRATNATISVKSIINKYMEPANSRLHFSNSYAQEQFHTSVQLFSKLFLQDLSIFLLK